jgi:hypothetical protein
VVSGEKFECWILLGGGGAIRRSQSREKSKRKILPGGVKLRLLLMVDVGHQWRRLDGGYYICPGEHTLR